jgi:hypothetical protein
VNYTKQELIDVISNPETTPKLRKAYAEYLFALGKFEALQSVKTSHEKIRQCVDSALTIMGNTQASPPTRYTNTPVEG